MIYLFMYLFMFIFICIYTYIYIYIYTYIHTLYIDMCTCMHIFVCICTCIYMYLSGTAIFHGRGSASLVIRIPRFGKNPGFGNVGVLSDLKRQGRYKYGSQDMEIMPKCCAPLKTLVPRTRVCYTPVYVPPASFSFLRLPFRTALGQTCRTE